MTPADLEAMEQRVKAATPGEWYDGGEAGIRSTVPNSCGEGTQICVQTTPENAAFIAHSRTDMETLLAEVKRLQPLQAALDSLLLLSGRTGDALIDFEDVAEAYYKETGRLRPGKSESMATAGRYTEEQRWELFRQWVDSKLAEARLLGTPKPADVQS